MKRGARRHDFVGSSDGGGGQDQIEWAYSGNWNLSPHPVFYICRYPFNVFVVVEKCSSVLRVIFCLSPLDLALYVIMVCSLCVYLNSL